MDEKSATIKATQDNKPTLRRGNREHVVSAVCCAAAHRKATKIVSPSRPLRFNVVRSVLFDRGFGCLLKQHVGVIFQHLIFSSREFRP